MNNSLAEVHPELIMEWPEKNLPLTLDDITFVLYITVVEWHVKSRRFCRLFCDGILPILEGALRT